MFFACTHIITQTNKQSQPGATKKNIPHYHPTLYRCKVTPNNSEEHQDNPRKRIKS
nr:MAG TPA: hypothetical protein [Caudoviricetes sp.]